MIFQFFLFRIPDNCKFKNSEMFPFKETHSERLFFTPSGKDGRATALPRRHRGAAGKEASANRLHRLNRGHMQQRPHQGEPHDTE